MTAERLAIIQFLQFKKLSWSVSKLDIDIIVTYYISVNSENHKLHCFKEQIKTTWFLSIALGAALMLRETANFRHDPNVSIARFEPRHLKAYITKLQPPFYGFGTLDLHCSG